MSKECCWVWAEDASFVSGIVVSCRCHRESRPQEGGGIAQAWVTWPEGASAPNGTVKCRGHGVKKITAGINGLILWNEIFSELTNTNSMTKYSAVHIDLY